VVMAGIRKCKLNYSLADICPQQAMLQVERAIPLLLLLLVLSYWALFARADQRKHHLKPPCFMFLSDLSSFFADIAPLSVAHNASHRIDGEYLALLQSGIPLAQCTPSSAWNSGIVC